MFGHGILGAESNRWTSADSGATWNEVTSASEATPWCGVDSSADGSTVVTAACGGDLRTSTESGATRMFYAEALGGSTCSMGVLSGALGGTIEQSLDQVAVPAVSREQQCGVAFAVGVGEREALGEQPLHDLDPATVGR